MLRRCLATDQFQGGRVLSPGKIHGEFSDMEGPQELPG